MALLRSLAVLAMTASVAKAANPTTSEDMGPAAFMWPEDRVALVDQKEAYSVELSILYDNGLLSLCIILNKAHQISRANVFAPDPKEENDFKTLIKPEAMAELDKGHTCVNLKNSPSFVKPGSNATLQIKYVASFDKPENETFYACADITYVEFANFKEKVPCFNAMVPDDSKKDTPEPTSDASKNSDSTNSGLSGGNAAGVVIDVVDGVALIAAAALLIYRRKQ
ncbi:hypothetical protein MAC_06067 [Metarhizium acridum CQMa 102]|uniref:Copper acquisition factor BIM1-like domain-containing protein n=1 Tax=Metarhizium acridum (strain CQMa 102) TaxID=655827 RepID=E9E869_METAQ|nr:uncharacterized protein MAC_06067 [Metarhizium acridum CQMa 102]EFY87940.1 hypothetical protein MAC_06067 [Metarhizium acridum CQMa 102]